MTPQQEKTINIFDTVLNTALRVQSELKQIPKFYKKRPFNKIDRRPIVRIRKKEAKRVAALHTSKAIINLFSGAAQLEMIRSQPIPKYDDGGYAACFMQPDEPELVIMPNQKGYWSPYFKNDRLPVDDELAE